LLDKQQAKILIMQVKSCKLNLHSVQKICDEKSRKFAFFIRSKNTFSQTKVLLILVATNVQDNFIVLVKPWIISEVEFWCRPGTS